MKIAGTTPTISGFIVMAVKFNRLVRRDHAEIDIRNLAEQVVRTKTATDKIVFMSHKTGDWQAEREARRIVRLHGVMVYMAEWDDNVEDDSDELPVYIMNAIRKCDGFLVNVTAAIRISMWIGYEIGGAHAMQKPRARIMYNWIRNLPSVVRALEWLGDREELDEWISKNVL